ncbi:MAG: PD40 domain-containing protein [Saprospiraceae bacterium]|nr:PD40 domain-containing protein [Saprospiraceae bacterium]
MRFKIFIPFLLLCWYLAPTPTQAQTTSQTSFGKNRVQYHRQFDEWMHYETANFDTYWYGDARNIAQSALQMAEFDFAYVQQLLEHQMSDQIELLVFSDLTDLKQSNIGEDDLFLIQSGETKVVGNKIFVYFDGDHRHLRAQIREGSAGVLINSMLFGANLQEIVQNAVLLNLPGWYTQGLTAYCGEDWNAELDNQLRDLLLTDEYDSFDKLAKDQPRLAGQVFWYYIALHFGKGTISNLLYLTRINRSVDAGFLYVLGGGYRRTTDALMDYFRKRYREEAKGTRAPEASQQIAIKNKKKLPLNQLRISPDGQRIAWVSNDIGKWRVWVQDLQTGKRQQLLKGGVRNALQASDYNYPILAWHPDNQRLAVLYERRDVGYLALVDLKTRKKEVDILSPEYQRVYSMDYLNPIDLVFSACVKGYSDLFIYHTVNRNTERLTQDFWDDLDASVATIDGQKGILFASNRLSDTLSPQRLDTILPTGQFDIFYFDLGTRSKELIRITETPFVNERDPWGVDSTYFTYLSDESGVVNRQAGYLKTYTAFFQDVVYLKDGTEVRALHLPYEGEWPQARAAFFYAPLDTVLQNIDSTQIDSIRTFPVFKKRPFTYNLTNYDRNIAEQHLSPRSRQVLESQQRDRKTIFYRSTLHPETAAPAWITRYRELYLRGVGQPVPAQPSFGNVAPPPGNNPLPVSDTADGVTLRAKQDSVQAIDPGWLFQVPEYLLNAPSGPAFEPVATPAPTPVQPPVEEPEPEPEPMEIADTLQPMPSGSRPLERPSLELGRQNSVIRFSPSKIVPYRLRFRTDYISTTMDNNLLFEGLDSYAGSPDGFRTPPPGVLLRANFKDLLEDYVVEAGFRLPTTFNGAEYYLWLDNKKRRLDKRIALYRKTVVNSVERGPNGNLLPTPIQVRTNTLLGQYEMRYPLDAFFSLRGMGTLRQDKAITLSTNRNTLESPNYSEQRASLRLSAVYDNTVDIDLNLRTGTRAKLFVEAVKRFEFNTQPNWSLKFNKGFMTVLGLDARHYQRLDRRSILAVRLAAATTFGSERILYFLGGVDNWLFPSFNNSIPVPQNENFAYQTLAANLRGFKQNIRNGSSYALINSELRVPIFKYFSQKPVMGSFWRNFQLIGFFDVGTAWQGKNPYRGDNPLNTIYVYNPPTVAVKVNYFRDPLVAGYGIGVRAPIFGMYLRLDYGWGIETRVIQDPVLHIALGTDF